MTSHSHVLSFDRNFRGLLLTRVAIANLVIMALYVAYGADSMKEENGILETFQLLLLFGTTISFGVVAVRSYRDRIAATGAVAMCVLFFFRELEVHGVHPVFEFLSSDPMLYVLGGVFGIWMGITCYLNRAQIPVFWAWLTRLEWWPFLIVGVLLIASHLVEWIGQEFIEELLETNAYVVLATAGGVVMSASKNWPKGRGPVLANPSHERANASTGL